MKNQTHFFISSDPARFGKECICVCGHIESNPEPQATYIYSATTVRGEGWQNIFNSLRTCPKCIAQLPIEAAKFLERLYLYEISNGQQAKTEEVAC